MVQGIVTGHRRSLEDLVRAIDRTGIRPVIHKQFNFVDLRQALDHLQAGAFGKVVIDIPHSGGLNLC